MSADNQSLSAQLRELSLAYDVQSITARMLADAATELEHFHELSKAVHDVIAERRRHVSELDYTETHDDQHDGGELSTAGACYALNAACVLHPLNGTPLELGEDNSFGNGITWPWEPRWWKPKDPRRDLVRAASLLVAEIERLDRVPAANVEPPR